MDKLNRQGPTVTGSDGAVPAASSTLHNSTGAFSSRRVRLWMGVMGAVCMFLALDFAATQAMRPPSASFMTTTMHGNQPTLLRRRRLDDIPIGEQVEQAIQDSMASGELGSDNPAVVNVSWVPLEDLEDGEGTREISPPTNAAKSDDGLDRLWIIIMIVAGCVVLCLIFVACYFLRKADEDENGDDAGKDDEEELDNDGAMTNEEEEEEDDDEYEEVSVENEESSANDVEPNDPGLGRFEITN